MRLPATFIRQQETGVSQQSVPTCKVFIKALKSVNLSFAERELNTAKRLSAGLCATGISLMLVWVFLSVVRFRVLRRRPSRLITDIAAGVLAATSVVLFVIASSSSSRTRAYKFMSEPLKVLNNSAQRGTTPYPLTGFINELPDRFKECETLNRPEKLGLTSADKEQAKAAADLLSLARPVRQPVIHVLAVVCVIASAIAFLSSIVSAILAGFVKAAPEEDAERTWAAPPRVSRPTLGPSYQFFHRFLEPVTPPPEGVFGGREHGDCRICLEALTDDISRLSACAHAFHRKCILQWLVKTDKPCCPLCKEPVRLVQR